MEDNLVKTTTEAIQTFTNQPKKRKQPNQADLPNTQSTSHHSGIDAQLATDIQTFRDLESNIINIPFQVLFVSVPSQFVDK